jgi:oligopeptide transport system substrate-binding protein
MKAKLPDKISDSIHACLSFMLCLVIMLSATACFSKGNTVSGGSGTLNLADTGPVTLDPATIAETTSANYVFQIFSGLVRYDTDLHIQPDIAQSWSISPDGLTYTFHLRTNVKFQDGNVVTANDFKYSWERALSPATGSLTAVTYLSDIDGASDIINGNSNQLKGVRVTDNNTLEVKITTPVPYFIDKLSYPTSFVVERSNVESGTNWWQKPIGTGPFKLVQWIPDQKVILGRNPLYYGEKARLNQVVFQLYSGDPMQLYQEGSIDATFTGGAYTGLVTDPTNQISKELNISPELSLYYIGFNCQIPPFDDPNIRLAFCYAVDKSHLLSLSTQGDVILANGLLPPDMPGYNLNLQAIPFDPAKAKKLISESKYGDAANLPPIVFTTSGWGGYISGIIGGLIEEWRTNLGVEVTVRQIEPEQYFYYIKQEVNNIFDTGWIADYPDPQDFIELLLETGQQNNIGSYSNTQVDSLINKASIQQDTSTRNSFYNQAEQMAISDGAVLPLFFNQSYVLAKPNISGYKVSPLGYVPLNLVSKS